MKTHKSTIGRGTEDLQQLFRSGDHARVKELLAGGAKVPSGLLSEAAVYGNSELVQLFLKRGVKKDEKSDALLMAIVSGHEDLAVDLIDAGANPWGLKPDITMIHGPPLHLAVMKNMGAVVQACIRLRVDLNVRGDIAIGKAPRKKVVEEKDARGNVKWREHKYAERPAAEDVTALIAAVRAGKEEMARLLAEGGADLEATDPDGFTAMDWAINLDRKETTEILRRAGAKLRANPQGSPINALVSAAGDGNIKGVEQAQTAGAEVNELHQSGEDQVTALMRAAERGHLDIVNELLGAGADPNIAGIIKRLIVGVTPLILAAKNGHGQIVKRLLEAGANPDAQQDNRIDQLKYGKLSGDSALHEAASAGHEKVVKILLAAGATVSLHSRWSGSPLDAASEKGNHQVMNALLAARSKKSKSKPKISASALVNAAGSKDIDAVRQLLDAGADVNARTRQGEFALQSAVAQGDAAIVKLLIEHGAKPTNGDGKSTLTELMMAASRGYTDLMELLIKAGAGLNDRGMDQSTALHIAVTQGKTAAVKLLLKAGADPSIPDRSAQTPLALVRKIISTWTNNPHPMLKRLPNMPDYKRIESILEKSESRSTKK